MDSILKNISSDQVRTEPFPHIVIENALSVDLALQLLAEFPKLEVVTQSQPYGSNERFSYNAADSGSQGHLSLLWQEFVRTHINKEFYLDFVRLFGSEIKKKWPQLGERLTASSVTTGVRNRDSMENVDVVLECQVCLNTPVVGRPTSVKIAHLDNSHELFAGLLYLRPEGDDSRGANLELYRYRTKKPKFHGARLVDRRFVEKVTTVPYKHNTLILFLNTFDALHGVTARSITEHPRRFVNFLAEIKEPLFNLGPYKENLFDKTIRHF